MTFDEFTVVVQHKLYMTPKAYLFLSRNPNDTEELILVAGTYDTRFHISNLKTVYPTRSQIAAMDINQALQFLDLLINL